MKYKYNNKQEDEPEEDEDGKTLMSREKNHIYFYSDITRNSVYELMTYIREAEKYCVVTALELSLDEIPIYLHINS